MLYPSDKQFREVQSWQIIMLCIAASFLRKDKNHMYIYIINNIYIYIILYLYILYIYHIIYHFRLNRIVTNKCYHLIFLTFNLCLIF